jgi:hypothetical protein
MKSEIGLPTILTVVFIILKLCDVIKWGWIWVLAPAWGSFLFGMIIFIIACVIRVRQKSF